MEDVSFVRAVSEDLTDVVTLLERCGLPAQDLSAARLEHFTLCKIDGSLAGTVGLEVFGDLGLLRSLAVVPEARGRRLGHALWERARATALRHGVRSLFLFTTTAEPLFACWGFWRIERELLPSAIQTTDEFTSLCPSTAVAMALTL